MMFIMQEIAGIVRGVFKGNDILKELTTRKIIGMK